MGKTITIADNEDIIGNMSEYSRMINLALEHNDGSHSLSSIITSLLLGKFKLIACKNDNEIITIGIIEFINYPEKRICNIAFLSSVNVFMFKHEFLAFVFKYAKECGANSVQAYGRKGWKRFLSKFEFKEIYTVLERSI